MLRKSDHQRCVDYGEPNAKAPAARSGLFALLSLGTIALAVGIADVKAQEAEPRSYSNTPVGLNFLIAGYVFAQGKLAFDPNLSIADANFRSSTGCPSSDNLRLIRQFEKGGSGSSGVRV
jgi:hypothetical protein